MARENTKCVARSDYVPLNPTPEIVTAVASLIAAIFTFGITLIVGIAAAFAALRKVIRYMLYGKLVCLGGDRCAIGWIVEIEEVGYQKDGLDAIDDDYSLNVMLAPSRPADFEGLVGDGKSYEQLMQHNHLIALSDSQGTLLAEQPDMPEPREPEPGFGRHEGYYTRFKGPDIGERVSDGDNQWHTPATYSDAGDFPVPVLHAECEGSRPKTLLDVLDNFPPGIGVVCEIPILGPIACAIVAALLAPFVLAALLIAWAAADEGDQADVVLGGGTVKVGDLVILRGRWTWDAGHGGWNELHPLKTVQKLPTPPMGVSEWEEAFTSFDEFLHEWCEATAKGLPTDPELKPGPPGTHPLGLTPGQQATWEAQQQPENDWELHPDIDGCQQCEPEVEPEPPR